MTGTIHLIVEDQTDADVVNAILEAKKIDMRARPLKPPGGTGGISRLAANIEALIENAIKLRQKGECIAVLHDNDITSEKNRSHHEKIRVVCEKYPKDVKRIIAKDEIESWLLSDEGLCRWLEEKPRESPDGEHKPSERLKRAVKRKTKHDYGGKTRAQVLSKLDGSGDKHSESMRDALAHLHNAPCMRQN